MQSKDVPALPVLKFLAGPYDGWDAPGFATWFWSIDYKPPNSVLRAMPDGTPEKVALAKMRSLIKRGLVAGCACGCRGDFEITDEGRTYIASRLLTVA
jgi:hypothetical protein